LLFNYSQKCFLLKQKVNKHVYKLNNYLCNLQICVAKINLPHRKTVHVLFAVIYFCKKWERFCIYLSNIVRIIRAPSFQRTIHNFNPLLFVQQLLCSQRYRVINHCDRHITVLDTTLCDKVCQWLATDWWFSPDTLVSCTNKTDRHDITEILLKVALNTITPLILG
jgi:hypothetical protein